MALQTETTVGKVDNVQDSEGRSVKPASADFHHAGDRRDLATDPVRETFTAPDRADVVRVLVEPTGAATVTIEFLDAPDGDVLVSRGPADASGYETDGTADIFAECAVAAPYLRVRIEDTSESEGANVTGWSVYAV